MRAHQSWIVGGFLLAGLVTQLFAQPGYQPSQGVRWQPNLETARSVAARTNRFVLVHFYSDSCGPCMRMEREVFPRADVAAALDSTFVPVKINAQQFPALAEQFGVRAYPTDVLLTPQGQVVFRRAGGLDATQYVATLNQAAAAARERNRPAFAAANPNPPVANAAQATAPNAGGFDAAASRPPAYPAGAGMDPASSGRPDLTANPNYPNRFNVAGAAQANQAPSAPPTMPQNGGAPPTVNNTPGQAGYAAAPSQPGCHGLDSMAPGCEGAAA